MHFNSSYILMTCLHNENPLKPRQVITASDITKTLIDLHESTEVNDRTKF